MSDYGLKSSVRSYEHTIPMGESWKAVQGITGQSPAEFAATMTTESKKGCYFQINYLTVEARAEKPDATPELVLACASCVRRCFEERIEDIEASIDDIDSNHCIATHVRDEEGSEQAYSIAAAALQRPTMPSEFAALRRARKVRPTRANHVIRPDVESESYRGYKVQNINPNSASKLL